MITNFVINDPGTDAITVCLVGESHYFMRIFIWMISSKISKDCTYGHNCPQLVPESLNHLFRWLQSCLWTIWSIFCNWHQLKLPLILWNSLLRMHGLKKRCIYIWYPYLLLNLSIHLSTKTYLSYSIISIQVLDASWYMPDEQRNPIQEYQVSMWFLLGITFSGLQSFKQLNDIWYHLNIFSCMHLII